MSPINPVVSGLLQGFNLASRLKQQRMQQEAMARMERRDAEEIEVRDLQTKMALRDRGYEESTPAQDAEIATGRGYEQTQLPGVMGTTTIPSDIKSRTAKYKGTTYVRKSKHDLKMEADEAHESTLGRKVKEASVLGSVKVDLQKEMDQVDVPGMGRVDKNVLPFFSGQANREAADKRATATSAAADARVDKQIKSREKIATMPARRGSGASGGLTAYQQTQLERQQKLDAAKAQGEAKKEVDTLQKQEQLLHKANEQIGERLRDGSKGKNQLGRKIEVTDADAAELKRRLTDNQKTIQGLQQKQQSIIQKFGGAPAAPAAAPTGAKPKTWEEFKRKKAA